MGVSQEKFLETSCSFFVEGWGSSASAGIVRASNQKQLFPFSHHFKIFNITKLPTLSISAKFNCSILFPSSNAVLSSTAAPWNAFIQSSISLILLNSFFRSRWVQHLLPHCHTAHTHLSSSAIPHLFFFSSSNPGAVHNLNLHVIASCPRLPMCQCVSLP